ncbi:D-aminoacyl-tRNA deacylase [Bifidobacterium commune]|uniref:D-aminoacyl-tRNA deacylase n=1 Tax=Bifidobacterium commune TaxID=1505727 RepID=A0A1C4H006_9BIFI|nr:D-aminoacyl-tRNA deacylase [Bifidobacterium commune]SCC78244.1 D-tyrosyl-tRNA(Tyr) deacylase [Bifidobacterium commune]
MKIVLQKVSKADIDVVDETSGDIDQSFKPQHIDTGYVLLVGVSDEDGQEQIDWLASKIAKLRVFEDENGKMNLSLDQVGGEILSVSQFTLFGDVRRGNRPSFVNAGKPEHAKRIWLELNQALRDQGITVKEGRFGSHMRISLTNDGPITILFDTDDLMSKHC